MGDDRLTTILLTGAGGAATPTLIEHLQGLGYRVIACDMDKHAVGLLVADRGYAIPPGDSAEWTPTLQRICEHEGVAAVIPLVDEELLAAHDLRDVRVVAPQREFMAVCLDKWRTMQELGAAGVLVPATTKPRGIADLHGRMFPAVLKPRRGHGSKGVVVAQSPYDLRNVDWRPNEAAAWLVQDYIDGPEYTVSVVCDSANTVHAVVPKEVISKKGITRLAVTRRNERIDAVCRRIVDTLQPCGPFNVQCRLRDGEPYVFEINPRFSGTVNLTIQAGCDEVGGLVALALGRPWAWGEWREGVVLVRRYADVCSAEPLRKVVEA